MADTEYQSGKAIMLFVSLLIKQPDHAALQQRQDHGTTTGVLNVEEGMQGLAQYRRNPVIRNFRPVTISVMCYPEIFIHLYMFDSLIL